MSGTFSKIPKAATRGKRLLASEYFVLGVLCDYADRDGWCWPKQITIAKHTGLSDRWVQKVVDSLETKGLIQIERGKPTGRGKDKVRFRYRVLYSKLDPRPDDSDLEYQNDTSGIGAEIPEVKDGYSAETPELDAGNTGTGAAGIPELERAAHMDELDPGTRLKERDTTAPLFAAPLHAEPDELEKALQLWNETAVRCHLPKAKMTGSRRPKLKARLRECNGLDGWRQALAEVEGSPFLRGAKGWRANLDFLLQEASLARVLEGTYRPVPATSNGHGRNGAGSGGQIPIPTPGGPNPHGLREKSIAERRDLVDEENARRAAQGLPRLYGTEHDRFLVDQGIWPYDEKPRQRSATSYP